MIILNPKTKSLFLLPSGIRLCFSSYFLLQNNLIFALKMSVELGREDKIYDYMHKLRRVLKGIDESIVAIIEGWFKMKRADD